MKKPAVVIVVVLLLAYASLWGLAGYYQDLPNRVNLQETIIMGQSQFTPGYPSSLRVVVRDVKDGAPIVGAQVNVSLRAPDGRLTRLYEGTVDEAGNANAAFQVPEDAVEGSNLLVETRSSLGVDRIENRISVKRDYRVLLTTDKPIYQPGQTIHMRALALSTFDLIPAENTPLDLTVEDGKGNKIFQKALVTDAFGVAFADFTLANEVNTGNYKISAVLSGVHTEKTVVVEHYNLPKFAVGLTSDSSYYLPGQAAQGTVHAAYFYGKPVAGGQVGIEGYIMDVERETVFEIQGTTDEAGNFTFDFDVPETLAASSLDGGTARFYLQASVTDRTNHRETALQSIPVAREALVIKAIPEGGQFRPGVDNILYVLTAYPDGTPAPTALRLTENNSREYTAETGPHGLAEVHMVPQSGNVNIAITAQDDRGASATRSFDLQADYMPETVLLRPEHPVYRVGDTMNLTILASQPSGTVYLDIVRQGQTLSTRAITLQGGRTDIAVDLTPDLYGTLEMHAYKLLPYSQFARDTRLVVVDSANDLQVTLRPGQESYRPGEQAQVDVTVTGQDGAGVRSALGLAIVDEAVFAVADQDPGFARLYFQLEQELLTPTYDIHGFSVPDLVRSAVPVEDPQLHRSYEGAAFAALAAAAPQQGLFSLHADTYWDAARRVNQLQQKAVAPFFNALSIIAWIIALGIFVITVRMLARRARFWSALGILGMIVVVLIALAVIFYPLAILALIVLAIGWGVGLLMLLVQAVASKDLESRLIAGLITAYAAFFFLYYVSDGKFGMSMYAWMPASLLVVISAVLLLTVGSFFWQRDLGNPSGLAMLLLVVFLVSCSPAMPTMAPAPGANPIFANQAEEKPAKMDAQPAGQEEPRLRQYFPETLLWLPDAVTGEDGRLHLDFSVADSITTWRMTALASTKDGRLGSTTAGLRVFQDFFIDIDLPLSLTVGDEISVPVGVYNYLKTPQTVRLELDQSGWFELLDEPVKVIDIAANDIQVVSFRVRVTQFGTNQPFTVTAIGSTMSDAIQRTVRVFPDGKELVFTQSDRLAPGQAVIPAADFPAEAIPGTTKLLVKIYPGILSQVVEGLESILRMPSGCFEQTSTTSYPNVLVLDYLKTTGQVAPEIQMKAEQYINVGYQRLTTFEVQGGGFSLFGDAPADRMLTAYGLQEFSDMRRVHPVDEDLIARTADWLLSQQKADGSWAPDDGMYHEAGTWQNLHNSHLPTTAYIVWSLMDAGFATDARTQKGVAYLLEHQAEAEDPYVLGLLANALVANDLHNGQNLASSILDRLAALANRDGDTVYWRSEVATFMGGQGTNASIETTALSALALLRSNTHAEQANGALLYLVRQKDSLGTWYSTQSTIWSLKALLESVRGGTEQADAVVTVRLNGSPARTLSVTPQNSGVVQMLVLDDLLAKNNMLEILMEGEGSLMYQVTGSYYLPWDQLPALFPLEDGSLGMTLDLMYDRTQLQVEDTIRVNVRAAMSEDGATAQSAMISLGVPPGFAVLTEDLDALVAASNDRPADSDLPAIERYEMAGRQVLIYITNLGHDPALTFHYRLQAKYPVKVQSPASSAYDYYNPQISAEMPPLMLEVLP